MIASSITRRGTGRVEKCRTLRRVRNSAWNASARASNAASSRGTYPVSFTKRGASAVSDSAGPSGCVVIGDLLPARLRSRAFAGAAVQRPSYPNSRGSQSTISGNRIIANSAAISTATKPQISAIIARSGIPVTALVTKSSTP